MIRTELDLQPIMPFNRATAARLAAAASRYESRLTLECEGLVLNMKSMLGLLSQAKLPEAKRRSLPSARTSWPPRRRCWPP
jgi:hypothetical protein